MPRLLRVLAPTTDSVAGRVAAITGWAPMARPAALRAASSRGASRARALIYATASELSLSPSPRHRVSGARRRPAQGSGLGGGDWRLGGGGAGGGGGGGRCGGGGCRE